MLKRGISNLIFLCIFIIISRGIKSESMWSSVTGTGRGIKISVLPSFD